MMFTDLIDCFISRRVDRGECYKVLEYFFGDHLKAEADSYIASQAKILFRNPAFHDDARIKISFIIEILEQESA